MQLLICDKGGVEVGAVLFKVGFPQPPVMPDIRARGGGGVAIVNEYSHAMRSPFSVEAAGNSRASCCSFSRSCCSFHCLRFFSI